MPPTPPGQRTTFLEFQARNRRATWKLSVAYALVVGAGGVLSTMGFLVNAFLVLFALGFLPSVSLLALGLLALASPTTRPLSEPLLDAAGTILGAVGDLMDLLPGEDGESLLVLGLLLPLACWLTVRAVWRAAGVGHALLAMGARPPVPGDLEERQLVNVVHEMAIAAGIPPPEVRLLDGPVANVAPVGADVGESYVVLGRRLLDEFDRDETQGLVAHAVGAIGNGDLRGAAQIHSLLYVLELLVVIVLAPFARLPRRIAARWLLFPLRAAAAPAGRAAEARALIELLGEHRARFGTAEGSNLERLGRDYFGRIGRVLTRICPPFMALVLFAQAATGFLLLFASVPVALLWRSRRYLADATAVELTRNPSGLYRALRHLGQAGGAVPGGEAVAHLFVVAPPPDRARAASASGGSRRSATFWEREGLVMGMHPALRRRLRRLERMGAAAPEPPGRPGSALR